MLVLACVALGSIGSPSSPALAAPRGSGGATCAKEVGTGEAPDTGQAQPVPGVGLSFDAGVTEADLAAVRTAILAADRYFREQLDFAFNPACIDVSSEPPELAGGAEADGSRVVIHTTADGWLGASWHLTMVTAHELVHVWQASLAGAAFGSEPAWLVEGSAELIALEVVLDEGIISAEEAAQLTRPPSGPLVPSLKAIESYDVLNGVLPQYRLALVAASWLTDRSGVTALSTFWTALGSGSDWQIAFEAAFGLTPAAFYSLFDPLIDRS